MSQIQKSWEAVKRLDRLAPNLYTSADPSGNGCTKQIAPLDKRGHLVGFRGQTYKSLGKRETAGPIGTDFDSRLRIHLGMDIG